jgi:hypothetical protein
LNGEDLNSRPDQSASRWIINFRDWPLERAEQYPDCMRIVRERVKPERDKLGLKADPSAKGYARLWWQFGRKGLDLYATIAGLNRVLVGCQTAKYVSIVFEPTSFVYSHATNVFAFDSDGALALLTSSIHDAWAREHSGSLETRLRYSPTDCFETFPFPRDLSSLDPIGESYDSARRQIMSARNIGLTQAYNLVHEESRRDEDVKNFRSMVVAADRAVTAAYDWGLDLAHGFHQTKQGVRFTISPDARAKVLDLLLALNHQRYAAEEREAESAPKTRPFKRKRKPTTESPLLESL